MNIIKIMNEYGQGPLWYCDEEGILLVDPVGFEIFTNDTELNQIATEIGRMYNGYYEFDSHDQACWFNEEQEKKDSTKMLSLLRGLRKRLDELNDGSFLIKDYCTKYYEELSKAA